MVASFEGNLVLASYLILLAGVLDFFDGFAARLLKAYSALGKELDSLADLISFGFAPAAMLFQLLRGALGNEVVTNFSQGNTLLAIPFLLTVFAGLRLAIFNIDTRQTTSFIGLPTPASALFVVGVVFGYHGKFSAWFHWLTHSPTALIIVVVLLSALMVSNIPMFSLKIKKGEPWSKLVNHIVLLVVSLIAFALLGLASFSIIIPAYIAISLVSSFFALNRN